MILIVDFGSQTTHLISRRLKELGVQTSIISSNNILEIIGKVRPQGIVLSGGPASVYEKGAPTINTKIFSLGIPLLGICYGLQLTAKLLGGKVISGKKEYGPVSLEIGNLKLEITKNLKHKFLVWMSHGDEVIRLPKGFEVFGSTEHVPFAFVGNLKRNIYGLQFHSEVEHTQHGLQILSNFVEICNIQGGFKNQFQFKIQNSKFKIKEMEDNIREIVGDKDYVIGAVSGGVDSTVAAALTAKAIGRRFIPIYVDNGLMRKGTGEHVEKIFKQIGISPIVVSAVGEMLGRLKKITDSEQKRKIIGNFYVEIFEREMEKLLEKKLAVKFLLQGTIYSDVIESQGTKHSARIKSHHNVGGLPKKMKLKLLEPVRNFYKDEVREIGRQLGLPEEFVNKQPFPGPGYAVRIRGEVTKERLEMERAADEIILAELEKEGILKNVFLSFPVMTGAYSTAVKGDGRQFGEVVALRIIESKDIMTTTWARLPYEILQRISSRIVNEVPNVSRVVYDITTKPPATMEWE
ncbi:MAG: glutamine-hydrolyzing GMP synthase [Candidatus Levybacteria bacterium]|nr:glutamine-hydrolyzing GMP synthase [Candidatus Levybacteria bacterium]MDZ4228375.1 glutamine-hydrolyzing GMP synthase [Candidatus Levybacteria bacterium]